MRLRKHHGLGNDFLVLVDPSGVRPIDARLARAVCDRHTGVGADGLLRATPASDGADVTMELLNADGSRAEMSGNGVSCLTQAVVADGLAGGPSVAVQTDAGVRVVRIEALDEPCHHSATVDMGTIEATADAPDWLGDGVVAARLAHAGNPHLVLHAPDPTTRPDLRSIGAAANAAVPGGINVEVVWMDGTDLHLDVYERGVGPTLACGTGASAAAVVAADWALVDERVEVVMPGGRAIIDLGPTAVMTVPVVAVADVDYLGA